uniref:GTx1-12 n=1 Tax=Grammostola rosea TaxID=432528 RepID=M5AWT6_GRARO|nr:GTx1-12 [Grammostola rosea]
MKTFTIFVIAGLALLSVVCYASEIKEQSSINEVLSAIFHLEQPQERDCLGWFKGCDPDNDKCCENYKCNRRDKWCKYKLWK